MSRSLKKGPYLNPKLEKKIRRAKDAGSRQPIRTWARSSEITPDMVGLTFEVHNGRDFLTVFVSESMVGHRLGEFSPTRTFRAHSRKGFKKPERKD